MEEKPSPSILEYVLRLKKVEVASSEAISQALEFEGEMNAWMDLMGKKERKEVKRNE